MDLPQLHMTNPDGSINPSYDDALTDLLTTGTDNQKCFGRAVAAGITQAVMDWVNAEIDRGTAPAVIMLVLAQLQIQQVASLAGNFLPSSGDVAVLAGFRSMLDTNFVDHAEKIRAILASEQTG